MVVPCNILKENIMLEIAAVIAIVLIALWLTYLGLIRRAAVTVEPDASLICSDFHQRAHVGDTDRRANIEAAKEMLAGSNRAIFGKQGELLGHVDTRNPADLRVARDMQEHAETAWRLAKDQVQNTYGLSIYLIAMRELQLN